ncbi:hypothetical protein NQ317_010580 [Molorchus minor]|uniref:Gag protein n=1 Tax=Molorchus minor TaxID=1323400 RepID=A0ABQ9J5W7_9CUCU|nr:hypothetical protein NQ317_010580 [Molorchus minor]
MTDQQRQGQALEPYKLSEIFSIIPEYDGNQINLNTFLNSCRIGHEMAVDNQKVLLTVHIKNKLKGRAAELVNSRNPSTWEDIKTLLENHFGDTRDLMSLIQDVQRMRQLPNESPLTFIARLQTHEAKMHAAVQKQQLSTGQKQAQIQLTEGMILNTLLTGLEPKIGHIVRSSNPGDMLTAISRVRRELQLNYFENQKQFNRNQNVNTATRKPNVPSNPQKQCSYCRRLGHTYNECRQREQNHNSNPNSQNYPRPFYNQNAGNSQNSQQKPGQQTNSNNVQQNRPPVIAQNPNFNSPRPPAIQQNPNYYKPNFNRRTFHLNQNDEFQNLEQFDPNYTGSSQNSNESHYTGNNSFENNSQYDDYYTGNGPENYYSNETTFEQAPVYEPDFQIGPTTQSDPPEFKTQDPNMSMLQTQFSNMNVDNFNPHLNFPEQRFL